ncbi:MAG: hypothetical protein ILP09_03345, partial [Oscillospiraceae bacterium]|nr:hypothetical protein [Oscillospiraceae bacterium]
SFSNKVFLKSGGRDKIYTINAGGGHIITAAEESAYEKYAASKAALLNVLTEGNPTNVFGLHFMKTSISKDSLVVAPHVLINGDDHFNYELPTSSIDFHLQEKGFINFFAGTYYNGNKSFFTLHQIFRNEFEEIYDIKEISMIYGTDDPADPYIYKYADNSYSGGYDSLPAGYTMKFNTAWIKTQSSLQEKALYYFEIPANEGEYALGSDPSSDGAYLIYLDISANAQILHRQDVTETVYKENVTCEYPAGVALSDSFTADTDSAAYRVSGGGTVALERSGSDATVSSDAAGEAVFIGEGVSLTSGGNAVELVPLTYNKETYRRVSRYDYNTVNLENTKKVILTTLTDTDGTETRTYTVNGESADGDDGAEIERGTLGLKYHYILPGGVTATDTVALSGVTETGYAGVTTQQYTGMELGAEPIDVTAQMLPIAYAVTIDVADGSITVNEDVISTNHSAEINGQFTFTAGDTLVLPTRSRALSVKKGAMSLSPPKSVQLVPDTSTGTVEPKNAKPVMTDETEYFWDVFSDMSLETWIRDPASFDAIADILTAGGDECDALWERIDAIEDEETYLTVCARIDDIFARLDRQDEEDEGTDLLMLSDEEFCALVTDPMMREILMELLSDAESEQYAELYRRTELIVSDRLFFRAYDHLKRLEQGDGRYAWSLMTDEEFAEWLMYPAEPAELAQLLWYPESEEGAALTERIYSVRDREKRGQCAERIKQLLRDYPPPVTYFWSEMTDEEFAEWICDEEAAEYLMMLLADAQSDETAALLEKAALMEAGEDADRVSERIEELTGELVRLIPWIFMNDEELLLWLADDENTGFIREVLALPESDAALMLADRIDAMESDELRNAAFERLAALAAVTEDKYTLPDMTDAELIALLGENREAVKMLLAERGMEAYNALLERIRAMEGEEDRAQAEALLDLLIAQEAEDAPPEGVPDDNEEKPPEGSSEGPGGDGEEPP